MSDDSPAILMDDRRVDADADEPQSNPAGDRTQRYPISALWRQRDAPPSATGAASLLPVFKRSVLRGQTLYLAGDTFRNLYQVLAGSLKQRTITPTGREQILDFPMPGSVVGLDGIDTGKYQCDVQALEDSVVCIVPYADLMAHWDGNADAHLILSRLIAQELGRARRLLISLGCMSTDERMAHFLVEMSHRMAVNGYSPMEFNLRMTREDIGKHLGMNLVTVSRVLTRLQLAALVFVQRKHLEILDLTGLENLRGQ